MLFCSSLDHARIRAPSWAGQHAAGGSTNHHFWKCSGGNGAAVGQFAADERQAVFETEHIEAFASQSAASHINLRTT